MAMLLNNTNRTRYNAEGELIRSKLPGFLALSLAYGQLLSVDIVEERLPKAFFLFPSFASATGEAYAPFLIRKMPIYASIEHELMPYSKKFTVSEEVSQLLVPGNEYWFTYTSAPVSKPIDGKSVTYEELALVHLADGQGIEGLEVLLKSLRLFKPQHQG